MKGNIYISVSKSAGHPYNGQPLDIVDLKSALVYCTTLNPDAKKGTQGNMYAYTSPKKIAKVNDKVTDLYGLSGVIFVDIDDCAHISDNIFNKFNEIVEYMPNLIGMQFSHSHNIHAYVYDEDLIGKDESEYSKKQRIWTAYLAEVIYKLLDYDLRQNPKMLDIHSSSLSQSLFFTYTPYQWNENWTHCVINSKDIRKLKDKYVNIFNDNKVKQLKLSTILPGKHADVEEYHGEKLVVNKDFCVFNRTGYEARTSIASVAYYHYAMDVDKTISYLDSHYVFDKEWRAQLFSLINNNNIVKFYNEELETFLFPDKGVLLDEGKYISDVLDLDKVNDKYIYIQSGTNTGKTEFVKRYLKSHDNCCLIQMTKALRDGKKQGVEDYTYNNWESITDKNKIHTTIEGFVRNSFHIDLCEYTVFVDETHLLQDYITVKYEKICSFLDVLSKANRIVFLSATPKQDINLYPFKVFKFNKKQPQDIDLYRIPIRYKGKGSKENAKYSFINKFVVKRANKGHKVIIFSDRNQESYKKYGLDKEKITLFNADNFTDVDEQAILQKNKLNNNITLATRYLGVGVEIKKEDEVDMIFCLDEGFTKDFIEQCLGRPRDAKKINVFFFYTNNRTNAKDIDSDKMEIIRRCFDMLNVEDEDGELHLNLIAAKGINLFDRSFNAKNNKNKIEILKIGNILDGSRAISASDIEVFKELTYNSVNCINEEESVLDLTGVIKKMRYEKKLEDYLLTLNDYQMDELFAKTYEELYDILPYDDKKNARKFLKAAKQFFYKGISLGETIAYFGKMNKADGVMKKLNDYISIKNGCAVLESIEGLEDTEEKIKKNNAIVEKVFDKDFLSCLVDQVIPMDSEVETDDIFCDVLGIENEPKKKRKIFNNDTYEDAMKKREGSGRANEGITIKNLETGEVFNFESKGECREFLNVSTDTFNKLLKGQKCKLSKLWNVM